MLFSVNYSGYYYVDSNVVVDVAVDLSSWEQKIQKDAAAIGNEWEQADDGGESVLVEHHSDVAMEMNNPTQELYKDGVLTLGCIGNPPNTHTHTPPAAAVLPHRL